MESNADTELNVTVAGGELLGVGFHIFPALESAITPVSCALSLTVLFRKRLFPPPKPPPLYSLYPIPHFKSILLTDFGSRSNR